VKAKDEHWIVEVTPDIFLGIANNRGYSLPATTQSLQGEAITKAEVVTKSDLLLCLDRTTWILDKNFERFFK
jgi:hypothetical protein